MAVFRPFISLHFALFILGSTYLYTLYHIQQKCNFYVWSTWDGDSHIWPPGTAGRQVCQSIKLAYTNNPTYTRLDYSSIMKANYSK